MRAIKNASTERRKSKSLGDMGEDIWNSRQKILLWKIV
nr:MAG TPA: hypothetical protein [Caudoviricetes sp.]